MATTWELLVAGSTLAEAPENSAWDHLNNLGGGTGGPGENIYVEALIDVEASQVAIDIETDDNTINVEANLPEAVNIEINVEDDTVVPDDDQLNVEVDV